MFSQLCFYLKDFIQIVRPLMTTHWLTSRSWTLLTWQQSEIQGSTNEPEISGASFV